jgi:acyl phosphate:glycerol-3-phosphate acyltransferase
VIAWVALLVGAYLVGAIPWSWVLVRWKTGQDIRQVGSGNVGATNAMRAAGKAVGVVALVLDIAKGVAPVLVARAMGAPPLVESCAATLAVLGHMYPVWLRFRGGGKGVATAAGALGALAPIPALLAAVVFLVVTALFRYVSLGSIAALVAFPLLVFLLSQRGDAPRDTAFLVSSALVPALSVWKHRGNIRRLLAGTERRLGAPREVET